MLSLIDGPHIDMALKGALVLMLLATAAISVRLARAETRLARASREAAEAAFERDGALAEQVRGQGGLAGLEHEIAPSEDSLRASAALVGERLIQAETEVERFEAAADARALRMRNLLAADPRIGETRFQTADRMIAEALRGHRA